MFTSKNSKVTISESNIKIKIENKYIYQNKSLHITLEYIL